MDFNERKRQAQSMLIEFLSVFSAPRGLDESQMANRISQIADAFARRMAAKADFRTSVEAVLQKVMDTHLSNTWPSQAAFVMAMPSRELREFQTQETFKPDDPIQHAIDRMESGQHVPEPVIWGTMSSQLPHRHLDRYRNASVLNWMGIYGADAAMKMRAIYGAVVDPYFPERTANGR